MHGLLTFFIDRYSRDSFIAIRHECADCGPRATVVAEAPFLTIPEHRFLRLVALVSFLLVVVCVIAIADAANSPRLIIGRAIASHDALDYQVTVLAPGPSVVAIFSDQTREASLEINGVVVQTVGRAQFIGHRPLAHGGASLLLSDLRSGERVVLRVRGTSQPPRIFAESDVLAATYRIGVVAGILYGLLATAMLFQIVSIFGYREDARFWYLVALLMMLAGETVRNDVWHVDIVYGPLVLLACAIGLRIAMVGFTSTYLGLHAKARGLLWFIVGANFLPGAVIITLQSLSLLHPGNRLIFVPACIGYAALVVVAAARWRAGFTPAAFLLSGVSALCTFFVVSIVLEVSGNSVPFFDWWAFEIAVAIDVLVFSLGVAYRDRFAKREQAQIERELSAATFAATHDPLTGLLNRRGLETWIESQRRLVATLLYLDIDGFKAVNDRGGHAAGDDTLRLVARIVHHAVREEDQCARMGGDEFLVVLLSVSDGQNVVDVVTRIISAVDSLHPLGPGDDTRIGMSIGVGHLAGAASFHAALAEADSDLYQRKSERQALTRTQQLDPHARCDITQRNMNSTV